MCDVLVNKRSSTRSITPCDYNLEGITVEAAHNIPATLRVTQVHRRTIDEQVKPNCISVNNGAEFNSKESGGIGVKAKMSLCSSPILTSLCRMAISNASAEPLAKKTLMLTHPGDTN